MRAIDFPASEGTECEVMSMRSGDLSADFAEPSYPFQKTGEDVLTQFDSRHKFPPFDR